MKIPILLVALCTLTTSCRKEEASSTAPESPTPSATEESEKIKDSEEPQEPEAQPKEEITFQQIKDLGSFFLGKQIDTAETTRARTTMVQLALAFDNFYENYQYLPGAGETATDTVLKSAAPDGSPLLAALLGLRSAVDENPKQIAFFQTKPAKDKKDGLHRTDNTADLYDPWGNPYFVLLNYDNDNQLRHPGSNEIFFDRRVVVWSLGPDGKSGTPETDKDNIYSWNRK
jgi:hypothetical protein